MWPLPARSVGIGGAIALSLPAVRGAQWMPTNLRCVVVRELLQEGAVHAWDESDGAMHQLQHDKRGGGGGGGVGGVVSVMVGIDEMLDVWVRLYKFRVCSGNDINNTITSTCCKGLAMQTSDD
jgi:hypothetical protein